MLRGCVPGKANPTCEAGVRVMPRDYFVIYGSCPTARSRSGMRNFVATAALVCLEGSKEVNMHGLIYLIGLIVVVLAILSFFGLR